jgi:hypothetical protein
MGFKDNLLRKIEIDQLAQRVRATLGPSGGELRIDKEAMRRLLALSPFSHRRERDLDLYVEETEAAVKRILVLDSELPIYRTTVEDVVLRKSPYVGEMVNLRNIIKILKDSDVKISRKEASLQTVQAACLSRLDLTFTEADIDDIRRDGTASLESAYAEGVNECLLMLAELLGWRQPPAVFRVPHATVYGAAYRKESGEDVFGPVVIYSLMHNELKLTEEQFGSLAKDRIERFHLIAAGKEKAAGTGAAVFDYLKRAVMRSRAMGN